MWTIDRIDESDFGCEERMPGEPLMLLVTLSDEYGRMTRFEIPETWIEMHELSEGDEWPEELMESDTSIENAVAQSEWMENYQNALDELKQSFEQND